MKTSKSDFGPEFRVLLVAQDAAFGCRLAQALDGPCGFRLCAHVVDVVEAETIVAEKDPELVVADTDPDHTCALPFLRRLAATRPERRLLATSLRYEPAEAEQVLRAGVLGLLLKTEPPEEILTALRTVILGQVYVSRALTMPLLKRLLSEPSVSPRNGVDSLTDRELRVFELLGFGLSKREVAVRLGVSCKTVESHRAKIQHRLGLESSVALAQYACSWTQRGLRPGRPHSNRSALGERTWP
jgi:DNA-binding NarL/FixJ family response regulator